MLHLLSSLNACSRLRICFWGRGPTCVQKQSIIACLHQLQPPPILAKPSHLEGVTIFSCARHTGNQQGQLVFMATPAGSWLAVVFACPLHACHLMRQVQQPAVPTSAEAAAGALNGLLHREQALAGGLRVLGITWWQPFSAWTEAVNPTRQAKVPQCSARMV